MAVVVGVWDRGFSISLTLSCFLMGILLLFSCLLSMAILGIGIFCSEVGLIAWLALGCGWPASWPFSYKYVCILLTKDEYSHSLGLQGLQDMICVVQSLLNIWIPFTVLTFTSTSTISCDNRHLKYLCTKLHSDIRMQAIWAILSYTVSCLHCLM